MLWRGSVCCPHCRVHRDRIFPIVLQFSKHVLDSQKCCKRSEERNSKPSSTEILGLYLRDMINHPRWCTKFSDGAQFSRSAEAYSIQIRYDHRFLHLVRKRGLKKSHYNLDKDDHLRLADVM